jgi:hypothetical protein
LFKLEIAILDDLGPEDRLLRTSVAHEISA